MVRVAAGAARGFRRFAPHRQYRRCCIVIGVRGMVGFASDLGVHVLVPLLLSPLVTFKLSK